jgi:hypothetical protein
VPAAMPLTTPAASMVATAGLLLLQAPPVLVVLSVVVVPTHVLSVPVMAAGSGLTVTILVSWQPPAPIVYVTSHVPADMPLTTPEPKPMVAMPGQATLQVPPAGEPMAVVVDPAHTCKVPVMAVGSGLMSTTTERWQPVGSVYIMLAVPDVRPDTMPVPAPTVATAVLLLLQVPPVLVVLSVVVCPTQALVLPVITAGSGFTVATAVRWQPVPNV